MARSRFIKEVQKSTDPSHAEVRRAKDFWTDVFEGSILAQIDDSLLGISKAEEVVRFAGEVADAALAEMEKRWPKI